MSTCSPRSFVILHPLGAEHVSAPTAREALRKAYVPGGFRQALAVIDWSAIMSPRIAATRATGAGTPFVAFIGEPAALAKGGAS